MHDLGEMLPMPSLACPPNLIGGRRPNGPTHERHFDSISRALQNHAIIAVACVGTCRGKQVLLDVARGLYYLHSYNTLHLGLCACTSHCFYSVLAINVLLPGAGKHQFICHR